MANWCTGAMKVVGSIVDIERYFREQILVIYPSFDPISGNSNEQQEPDVVVDPINGEITVKAKEEKHHYFYVNGSRRNFIEEDFICEKLMPEGNRFSVMVEHMEAAWSFDPDPYQDAAKKYNLEIHVGACECGCMFNQRIDALPDGTCNCEANDCECECEDCEFSYI